MTSTLWLTRHRRDSDCPVVGVDCDVAYYAHLVACPAWDSRHGLHHMVLLKNKESYIWQCIERQGYKLLAKLIFPEALWVACYSVSVVTALSTTVYDADSNKIAALENKVDIIYKNNEKSDFFINLHL